MSPFTEEFQVWYWGYFGRNPNPSSERDLDLSACWDAAREEANLAIRP